MTTAARPTTALVTRTSTGIVAGLAGGLVFGAMMAMMGMLPMIAGLVGSTSAVIGAVVHLAISAAFGALFALLLPPLGVLATLGAGAAYGVVWWVLGALVAMPLMMGMPAFSFGPTALPSLMGHIVFGLVAAGVLVALRPNRRAV